MPPMRRSPSTRRRAAVLAVTALALGACSATGARPSTAPTAAPVTTAPLAGEAGTATGDAAADAVLTLLDGAGHNRFTASYTIVRPLGQVTSTATVVHDTDAAAVTIAGVRFELGARARTCTPAGGCEDGTRDARVSDRLPMGALFFADRPARALRVSVARRAGPTTASTAEVAGRTATCVSVPVVGGTERYCASDLGAVAVVERADVRITLDAISATVDRSALAPS